MKLSKSFSVVAALLVVTLLCLGGFALNQNDNRLFFLALAGALFCSAFVYFGAFMQGLHPPLRLSRGRWRTLSEETEALAVANPDLPGLRKLFGWLITLIVVIIVLRALTLLAGLL